MMARQEDSMEEGVTTFPSTPTTNYRNIIFLQRRKLCVWLEDRSSKKRWQTSFLRKDDYVTSTNVFVNATPADYASLFKQSLDCSLDGNGDVQRKLLQLQDEKLRMELCTSIRLLNSSRSIRYEFELQPLAVSRIDILEAKLQDQQEEPDLLSKRVKVIYPDPVHLYVDSEAQLNRSNLQWKPVVSRNFSLNRENIGISVHRSGTYVFGVVVNNLPHNQDSGSISLQVNGVEIQRMRFRKRQPAASHKISTSLLCTARVSEGDHVAVVLRWRLNLCRTCRQSVLRSAGLIFEL